MYRIVIIMSAREEKMPATANILIRDLVRKSIHLRLAASTAFFAALLGEDALAVCTGYWLVLLGESFMRNVVQQNVWLPVDRALETLDVAEFGLILALSHFLGAHVGAAAVVPLALHRLVWRDMRVPDDLTLDASHFAHGGRRFLVTGAASGIGRQVVGDLSRQGHHVLATDVNFSQLQSVSKSDGWSESHVHIRKHDVTQDGDWTNVIAQAKDLFGGLDVCMNIAGVLRPGKIQEIKADHIHSHVDINVKGVMLGTMHASKLMSNQYLRGSLKQGGHIINISSMASFSPISGVGLYVGSKYAVRGFSLSCSRDLIGQGVLVSCVMPDVIRTPMVENLVACEDAALLFSDDALSAEHVAKVILGRVLITREMQVVIPSKRIRGAFARLTDVFSGAVFTNFIALMLNDKGMSTQRELKKQMTMSTQSRGKQSHDSRGRSSSPPTRRSKST